MKHESKKGEGGGLVLGTHPAIQYVGYDITKVCSLRGKSLSGFSVEYST